MLEINEVTVSVVMAIAIVLLAFVICSLIDGSNTKKAALGIFITTLILIGIYMFIVDVVPNIGIP